MVASPKRNGQCQVDVGVVMGSKSDWETMQHASAVLSELGIAHECDIVSAHRTPDKLKEYAENARSRGLQVIIAGAGGAAHLPGMIASQTCLPVLGVPVKSRALAGVDSLLSIAQMPAGVPVGTLAIGEAGAKNAAFLAARILALESDRVHEAVESHIKQQTESVLQQELPCNET